MQGRGDIHNANSCHWENSHQLWWPMVTDHTLVSCATRCNQVHSESSGTLEPWLEPAKYIRHLCTSCKYKRYTMQVQNLYHPGTEDALFRYRRYSMEVQTVYSNTFIRKERRIIHNATSCCLGSFYCRKFPSVHNGIKVERKDFLLTLCYTSMKVRYCWTHGQFPCRNFPSVQIESLVLLRARISNTDIQGT